ncbi:MAG: LpxI family protein [Candidatus Tectimicrobiota bacterium]
MTTPPTIGLIAGDGELPILAAQSARRQGYRVVAIGLSRRIASGLAPHVDAVFHYGFGQPRKAWATLRAEGVRDLIFLGRFNKRAIFNPRGFDDIALRFLRSVVTKEDRTLMEGIVEAFEAEGFVVRNQTDFLEVCLASSGVLSTREPTAAEWDDVVFGFQKARGIAALDIGETVVVKDQAIVAVEALEGTNACIERGCREVAGAVVVKVTRRHRDFRLDVPAVGPSTVELLVREGAAVLALEAGRVYVLEQETIQAIASKGDLAIVGYEGPEVGAPPSAPPEAEER